MSDSGRLGMESNLHLPADMLALADVKRTVAAELGIGRPLTNWKLVSGSIWESEAYPAKGRAMDLDGSTDYYNRSIALLGNADGKKGTFFGFFRIDGGAGADRTILHNTGGRFSVQVNSSNLLQIIGQNAAGPTTILDLRSSSLPVSIGEWFSVLASWDLSIPGAAHLLINGIDRTNAVTLTNDDIEYTRTSWTLGATVSPADYWNGAASRVVLENTSYVDLSRPANVDLFLLPFGTHPEAGGRGPRAIGSDASLPTGMAAILWFPSGDGTRNQGTGGNFVENGSPTNDWNEFNDGLDIAGKMPDVVVVESGVTSTQNGRFLARQGTTALAAGDFAYLSGTKKVRVWLPDSSDPNDTTIVTRLGYYFSNHGVTLPKLYDFGSDLYERFLNGGFESWTTGDPDDFAISGDAIHVEETVDVKEGSSALKITYDGDEAATEKVFLQDVVAVSGRIYRISGFYKTTTANAIARLRIADVAGTEFLQSDGRTTDTSSQNIDLDNSANEWRRFVLDLISFTSTLRLRVIGAIDSLGNSGDILFDGVRFDWVSAYEYHEPRLSARSIPVIEEGTSGGPYFGALQTGGGNLEVDHGDGSLYSILDGDAMGSIVTLDFGVDGLLGATTRESFTAMQRGRVQSFELDDERAVVRYEDPRSILNTIIPLRTIDLATFPNADPAIEGDPIPLLFGAVGEAGEAPKIVPKRTDNSSVNADYGKYLIADVTGTPDGLSDMTARIFTSIDDAIKGIGPSRGLIDATDVDYDTTNGFYEIRRDIQLLKVELGGPAIKVVRIFLPVFTGQRAARISSGTASGGGGSKGKTFPPNDKFDFTRSAVPYAAVIPAGNYVPATLAQAVEDAMVAEDSGNSYAGTYSESTHKFTVAGTSTFSIDIASGPNSHAGIYWLLGAPDNTSDDATGANSYTGNAIFTSSDEDHIIGMTISGYVDDGSGTYTGVVDETLEKAVDIVRFLLNVFLKVPMSDFGQGFVDERLQADDATDAMPNSVYIDQFLTLGEFLERLQTGDHGQFIITADGKWDYYRLDDDTSPAVLTLNDAEIQSYSVETSLEDVYDEIAVHFGRNPNFLSTEVETVPDDKIQVLHHMRDTRSFPTYLRLRTDAVIAADRIEAKTQQPTIIHRVSSPKLLTVSPGQRVTINREAGLGNFGALENVTLRAIHTRKDFINGTAEALLV